MAITYIQCLSFRCLDQKSLVDKIINKIIIIIIKDHIIIYIFQKNRAQDIIEI